MYGKSLMIKKPVVSIVIPTYNSENILEVILKGVANQSCPKWYFELIIADNQSIDGTLEIAKKYDAKIVEVGGKPPQVCRQRNLGAKRANGKYVMFLDHDVELSSNLIKNFVESLDGGKNEIDAWYLPYKNVASSKLLTEIRNLEDEFYLDSIVAAARLVKKDFLVRMRVWYDTALSSGPADWDFDLQLKINGARFGKLKDFVYHHEESLSFWGYITKKSNYVVGGEIYKKKWNKRNRKVYEEIVRKQFDPIHRLFGIFIGRGKWKRLLPRLHIYLLFLITKTIMAVVYYFYFKKEFK